MLSDPQIVFRVMVSGFRPFLFPASVIPDRCRFLESEHWTLDCPLLPCATCPNLRRAQPYFLSVTCLPVLNKPFLFPLLESSSHYSLQKDLTTRWIQRRLVVLKNYANNNARMDQQEENMLNTGRAVQALVAQVSELTPRCNY